MTLLLIVGATVPRIQLATCPGTKDVVPLVKRLFVPHLPLFITNPILGRTRGPHSPSRH